MAEPKFYLWYYAGLGILNGKLPEPFSSKDLHDFCEAMGLGSYYDIHTYNYYPHKHSINCGEENVTRVFVANNCIYEKHFDAPYNWLQQEKIYRLDRDAFKLEAEKYEDKAPDEFILKIKGEEDPRKAYSKFVKLLNELRRKGKISAEKRRELNDQWLRATYEERESLIQRLKILDSNARGEELK